MDSLINNRVAITVTNHVADVRLARPERMNALDGEMFAALDEVLQILSELADSGAVRCVVLSGEGKVFCAGLDKSMFAEMTSEDGNKALGIPADLMARTHGDANLPQHVAIGWRALSVPVIAAVKGAALGGGLQVMLGADIRLIAPDTRCCVMEISWGLVPDMGGMALMPSLVRDDVLRDLMFTGRAFDGTEAALIGLATRVEADPHAAAMVMARAIAGHSPSAMRASKRLANLVADGADPAARLRAESQEQMALIGGPEQREVVTAALQKRAPVFG